MGGASSGTTTMENTLGECRPAPPLGPEERRALLDGDCHDPHAVLGAHPAGPGTVIRALRPFADTVTVLTRDGGRWELLAEGDGLFAGLVPVPAGTDYRYELRYEDETVLADDPYRFQPTLGELDLHLIGEGRHERLWEVLGSRVRRFGDPGHSEHSESEPAKGSAAADTAGDTAGDSSAAGTASTATAQSNGAAPTSAAATTSAAAAARKAAIEAAFGPVTGVSFAVWAPNARGVRVIGDFNYWNGAAYPLRSLGGSGVWELFVPQTGAGVRYKYEILGRDGIWRQKADPLARRTEPPPGNASVTEESEFAWTDADWLDKRALTDPYQSPMSVYELHLQSWRPGLDYRQLADQLPAYLLELGFTHVEFLPPTEHPFGGSWGYQVSSYFAPTARLGDPDDFRALIDALHAAGIGVFIDWVPAHFPKDSWALAEFDGTALYEHSDPRRGEHPDWGTLVFDYGRREVRNFLVASALFWCEQMHIDGLRVDAVASMLYLDYSREEGEWHPNAFGGRENLEAVSFLQELTATAYKRSPGVVVVAEESTAWPGVTLPTDHHVPGSALTGLGFGFKWNMGWMHDTLSYMAEDPINRRYHHDKMTFALVYAYTEKFVLAISHDEVVHGKGSLLRKMSGDRWQQLANVRAYLAFMWAHPGKQLIFSGCEFAQDAEWSEQHGLDWWLLDYPEHRGVFRTVQDLNFNYAKQPALWEQDHTPAGFEWLVVDDSDHNVFAFVRWSLDGTPLVCVVNFAAVPWEDYHLPLPLSAEDAPRWSELLNTDAEQYGGSGVGNFGTVHSRHQALSGRPAHTSLRLPPLGTLWLAPERVARPEAELELEAELVAAAEVVAEAEQVAISAVEQEVFEPEADEPEVGEPEPVGEAEPASQAQAALLTEPVPDALFTADEPVSETSEALAEPALELPDTAFDLATELSDPEAEAEAESDSDALAAEAAAEAAAEIEAELAIISMIEPEVFEPEAFEPTPLAEPEPELDEPELAATSAVEPETDESEVVEPELIEPEAVDPEPATVPEPASEAPASATLPARSAPAPAFPGAPSEPEAEVPGAVFELAVEIPVTATEPPVESLAATAAVTTTPVVPRPAETDEPTVTLPIQSVAGSESMTPPVRTAKPAADALAQATQIPAQTTAEPAETADSAAEE
jgi:1,4-alpha-glucan branching enzyme